MKRYALALASLLLLTTAQGVAWAQTASEASIRKLLEVTETKKLVDGTYAQMDQMFSDAMRQSLGDLQLTPAQQQITRESQEEIIALIRREMGWDALEPTMIEVYRANFTEAEVQGMLKFYESDVGRAMIAKMPAVMQSTMQITQQRMSAVIPQMQAIQQRTMERLQALCQTERSPNCPQ